jgi:hypothetical protein
MKKQPTFLGIPYNWKWPTWKEINKRMWNKSDHRLFPPKAFGWGYTINFYELLHHRKKLLAMIAAILVIVAVLFAYKVQMLAKAHSTFENYYAFRGCVQLQERTDDYGVCKTNRGDVIKIVKFHDKWYLDGDLPCGFLCF